MARRPDRRENSMSVKPYILFTSPEYDKEDQYLDLYYKTFPTVWARFAIKLEPGRVFPASAISESRIKDNLKRQSELITQLNQIEPRLFTRLEYIKLQKGHNQIQPSLDILLLSEVQIDVEDNKKPLNQKQNADLVNELYLTLVDLLNRFLPEYAVRPVVSEKEYLRYYRPFDIKYLARIKRRQAILKVKDLRDIIVVNKASIKKVKSIAKKKGPFELGDLADKDYFYYIFPFISNNKSFEELVSILFKARQNLIYEASLFSDVFAQKRIYYQLRRIALELKEGKKNKIYDQGFYKSLKSSEKYFRHLTCQEEPSLDMTISVKSDRPLSKSLLTKIGQCITSQPDQDNQLAGGFDIFRIPASYVSDNINKVLGGNVYYPDETESIFIRVSDLRSAFWPEEASLAFRLPLFSQEFMDSARKNGWKVKAED
jgi:hypothetical protein